MKKELILIALLATISVLAPMVSYAGVSLIYPSSQITNNVNTNPPIRWAQGQDYSSAQSNGFAGSFTATNNAASFTLTVSGLSGGTVTIDKLVNCTAGSGVSTFRIQISSALSGTLSPAPTTLKVRLWTGATAPTNDGDAQVAGVLDLTASQGTQTAVISGNQVLFVQIICALGSSTTGSSSVSIQPSSITLA